MQQVIYLESNDLLAMKGGNTIQLTIGGATVMLGYMGRTYKKNGKNGHCEEGTMLKKMMEPVPQKKRSAWNKGLTMKKNKRHHEKKRPCELCGKYVHPMGHAPHMRMHERKGDVKGGVHYGKA